MAVETFAQHADRPALARGDEQELVFRLQPLRHGRHEAVEQDTDGIVEIAPRTILRRQVERATAMGFTPKMATELEFYLLRESFDEAQAKGYANLTPFGWYNEDYQLLQATKAEPLYRRYRNEMTAAGIPIEFSKGEAAAGQHEVNIHFSGALDVMHGVDERAQLRHVRRERRLP